MPDPALPGRSLTRATYNEYTKFTFGQKIFFWQVLPPQDEFTAEEI